MLLARQMRDYLSPCRIYLSIYPLYATARMLSIGGGGVDNLSTEKA